MPTIKLDDNPAQYRVECRPSVFVTLNALELSSAIVEAGATEDNATREQMVKAVRAVIDGGPDDLTDDECFALGSLVSLEFAKAGNALTPSLK